MKRLCFALALLIGAAVQADAACYQWSTTASSNAIADPTINWAEGMAPSSINDSARAMMARIAECRDDLSGLLQTAGTSTAYTVTTEQGLPSPPNNGQSITFRPSVTSGNSPTLAVDGGTAYPLQTAPGVNVTNGVLILGTPYKVTFNSTQGAWILNDFYGSPYSVPVGGMMPFAGTTPPNSSFVLPYGQAISRTTYATLFSQIGTSFGAGDGLTTFNVPDLRGRAVFGLDNMGGAAAGRLGAEIAGTTIGATGGTETSTLATANLPPYTPSGSIANGAISPSINGFWIAGGGSQVGVGSSYGVYSGVSVSFSQGPSTFTGNAQGGSSAAFSNLPPAIVVPWILRVI